MSFLRIIAGTVQGSDTFSGYGLRQARRKPYAQTVCGRLAMARMTCNPRISWVNQCLVEHRRRRFLDGGGNRCGLIELSVQIPRAGLVVVVAFPG